MDRTTDAQIPRALPVVPGLVLAGQYGLTERDPRHRGDTLGACALPQGRVGLMVADVVGHGPGASSAAAQLRTVLWSLLSEGAKLVNALEALDRHAARHPELMATSIGVVLMDLEDGSMEYAAAGLLPPLVLTPQGAPVLLHSVPMRPLGTGGTRHIHRAVLRPDDMLVLSTNGLVNTPTCGLERARGEFAERAARAFDKAAASGTSRCTRVDDVSRSMMSRDSGTEVVDDVAVLVAHRVPRSAALAMELDADTFDIGELRTTISGWLDGLGAGLTDHIGLGHALVELATNVVNHAYRGADRTDGRLRSTGDRPFRIDATLDDTGEVVATVSDRGEWRDAAQSTGHGLSMTAGLMDSLRVDRTGRGTDVEIRTRLARPIQLWQVDPEEDEASRELTDDFSTASLAGHLTVSGPVDEASADVFHAALVDASHAGTMASVIDLTGVSHLASPGVQSLLDLANRSARSGVRMEIVAPRRSPARQILDLVGLAAGP